MMNPNTRNLWIGVIALITSLAALLTTWVNSFDPPVEPPKTPTAVFTVSPAEIMVGNAATRTWTSTNATAVTINGVGVPLSGTDSITPEVGNHAYTLIATGIGGEFQVQATLNVLAQPPPPPPPTAGLVGGWRMARSFPHGSLAIDFSTNRCWMGGFAQGWTVDEFDLPPMGIGPDINQWPIVQVKQVLEPWWPHTNPNDQGGPYGLAFFRGKLWCSPRLFYDTAPPNDMTIYAQDGETIHLDIPRQRFAGFVKRAGQEPMLGGGGYDSSQSCSFGPALATLAGEKKIEFLMNVGWDLREKREPNYYGVKDGIRQEWWGALTPREVNGVLEGRWATDHIAGGGLYLPKSGITYWPRMGTQDLDYSRQNLTFGLPENERTYRYTYDPVTFRLVKYEVTDLEYVQGQEIHPDGSRYYLSERNRWLASGLYQDGSVVACYQE